MNPASLRGCRSEDVKTHGTAWRIADGTAIVDGWPWQHLRILCTSLVLDCCTKASLITAVSPPSHMCYCVNQYCSVLGAVWLIYNWVGYVGLHYCYVCLHGFVCGIVRTKVVAAWPPIFFLAVWPVSLPGPFRCLTPFAALSF